MKVSGVCAERAGSFLMAQKYAPWVALAYVIVDRQDQAEEIMSCMREVQLKSRYRMGPRCGQGTAGSFLVL